MAAMTDDSRNYLEGSYVVAGLRRLMEAIRSKATSLSQHGLVGLWIRELAQALQAAPLRVCGVTLVVAVLTHAALCAVLNRELTPVGVGWRIALLLIGLAGLANAQDWNTVKQGSLVVKFLDRRRPLHPEPVGDERPGRSSA